MKAFAPAQAAPVPVALGLPDGRCAIRLLEPALLDQAEAELAAEAARLPGLAARLMQDAAAARFALAREQVPRYGAWAYDWVQSYVNSYRVLWRLARGVAGAAGAPAETALLDRLSADIAAPMREAFRSRVLAPAGGGGGLAGDLGHAGRVLDLARGAALAAAAARLDGAPPAAGAALRFDLRAAGESLGPPLAAVAPDDLLDLIPEDGAEPPVIFLRSMRPMAARAGAVAVRVSEMGSVIAAGGGFGYAFAGVPGVALGLAGGIGLSWGIDWGINRVDAALNRTDFEAQALAAIGAAERRVVAQAEAAVTAALAARLAALRPGGDGCG